MATASANRLMNRSAFSSMYPRNVAGAGIVCRCLRKRGVDGSRGWWSISEGTGHVPLEDPSVRSHHVDPISSRNCTHQTSVSPVFSSDFLGVHDAFYRRYVISLQDQTIPDDDAAEGNTSHVYNGRTTETNDDILEAPSQEEKPRMSGAQRKKLAREEKKKRRGQNKGRRFQKVRDELDLCWKVAAGETCEFGSECGSLFCHFFVCLAEEGPDVGSRTMSRNTSPQSRRTSSSQLPLNSRTSPPL